MESIKAPHLLGSAMAAKFLLAGSASAPVQVRSNTALHEVKRHAAPEDPATHLLDQMREFDRTASFQFLPCE